MHRRSFLKSTGCAGAAAWLGSLGMSGSRARESCSPQASPPRWQTAIGLNGFMSSAHDYNKTYPLDEILSFARRAGFQGVELVNGWPEGPYPRADQDDRIAALKQKYDRYGLTIFSLQLGAAGAFHPDAQVRREWIGTIQDRARLAHQLQCDCIGMWPGGPLGDQTIDQAIDHLADSFSQVARIAEDLDLLAAFEIEPPFVFNTEEHLRRILEKVNHPRLKTIYDPSHFDLISGSTGKPHEMLARIGVDSIGYVHLTDTDGTMRGGTSKHLPCGEGHVDIPASLRTLRAGGFEGWIMIDAWKIRDPYEACRKGKQAIQQALDE